MKSKEFRSEMPATGTRPETARTTDVPMADLVKRLVNVFTAGDFETFRKHLTASSVWHMPGRSVLAGEHRGPDGIVAFLKKVGEETNRTHKPTIKQIMTGGEYATLWVDSTAERKGRKLAISEVIVFRIKGEQILEAWHYPEQPKMDEFYS